MSAPERPPDVKRAARLATGTAREAAQQGTEDRSTEPPEHRGERRRFIIWATMLGVVQPERVVERIVAEIESAR